MKLMLPLLLACSLSMPCLAQDIKYETSEPVNVSLAGWNKVLLMNNGNTLFFHFEPRKGIIVKVYDNTHKEIASQKHLCSLFDINELSETYLDGITEVNNEAVIFATQQIDNKQTLVRLRIDGNTGKLLAEDNLVQSASFNHITKAFMLKDEHIESYSVLTYQYKKGYQEKTISLQCYNDKNERIKDLPLDIDQKGYDEVNIKGMQTDGDGGVIFSVELCRITQFPNIACELILAYLPKDAQNFTLKKLKLPQSISQYSLNIAHNTFSKNLNMLITSTISDIEENGLSKEVISYDVQTLVVMNEDLSEPKSIALSNQKIKNQIKEQINDEYDFSGAVLKMSTNKFGLSTVVYDGRIQKADKLGKFDGSKKTLSFTQFNENGEEIWGTSIARSRVVNDDTYPLVFYNHNSAGELGHAKCFSNKNNTFVVFNEKDRDQDINLHGAIDTVFNSKSTNAICYRLNRKKELTKQWLFGSQSEGEYKQVYSGSGDFDEPTNMYATVYLDKKGKEKTTRIAWFQLEP